MKCADEGTWGRGDAGTRRHGDTRDAGMTRRGDAEPTEQDGDTDVVPASPRPRVPASPRPSSWRVFCAVEIPEKVGAPAAEHVRKLKSEFPHVLASWNREGKFHLTLKFFGNIPAERVTAVSRAASLAVEGQSEFKINVAGAGVFPKHGPPHVLWLGVEDLAGNLLQLQKRLEEECANLGFERETRPFHPHLTLARLRKRESAKELGLAHKRLRFEQVQMTISELLVIRSELDPEGSKYSEISRHPFSAR
jgi:2'-5' RNA ligase